LTGLPQLDYQSWGRVGGRQFPEVTRPELTYEKGQPSVAPMWQWTRQRLQATTPRSRSGQAARVWQQNRVFCALHTLHLRERLVETESAISDASPIVVIACSLAGS
jgi:hypothetical protein